MITDDVELITRFAPEYFEVLSKGKSKYFVKTLMSTIDKTPVTSELDHESNRGLTGRQDARIFEPV